MLKKSEFFQNHKVRILLCLELLLLLPGILGLLFGHSGLISDVDNTEMLIRDGIDLPAGAYTLRLYYDTEEESPGSFGINAENYGYRQVLANFVPIYPGIMERDCDFILTGPVENVRAELDLSEAVTVRGVELWADKGCYRVYLLLVILFSLLLDWILVLWMYNRRERLPVEKQLVLFGVPALAFAASLPILVDYNMIGADLIYHLMRIETLARSISNGEIFTRMRSTWLAGHGYASNFFYGDTFLAIPALLRIAGFNLDSAYRIYVGVVNLATALVAYLSFSRCFKSKYIGMFGCALYTLAPYRIYNIYNRAAVGEYTAMVFLPLLVWGFYQIYTEDPEKEGYLWNWAIPVIGFSGIIQSHTLSCEIAGGTVALMCLILWKKTFRKKTFTVLALVVVMTAVINAWFLVPFIDLMVSDSYYFGHNANVLIQERGVYPAQIFYTLQAAGSSSRFYETGMQDAEPIGLGAALLLCMGIWLILRAGMRKDAASGTLTADHRAEMRAGDVAFALCCITLFMTTNLFPWDRISGLGGLFASLAGSLQFPTRITAAVTVLAVTVACIAGKWLLEGRTAFQDMFLPKGAIPAFIVLVCVIFSAYQVNDLLFTRDGYLKIYSPQGIGYSAVLGAEYLPEGADMGHMTYHDPVTSKGVTLSHYVKEGLTVQAHIASGDAGYVDLPLLYYKGYSAKNTDSGEKLPVSVGEDYDVRISFPEGFDGNITVRFSGKWYWHAAECVSVLTGSALLLWRMLRRKEKD
ncbi:MAG: hypothetical protein NC420_02200 [Eubacterium sp.]|nr:hypothetical protein [Eubacterium sp.]MCM1214864.1 hypothetical protein [Lachnospiraceae bacterium]MCM1238940.1 hypothetical protein [Lachnospiraceae bacterium]